MKMVTKKRRKINPIRSLWEVGIGAIIVAVFFLFLFTNQGLNLILSGATKVVPGLLTFKQVTGRFVGPLSISGLSYKNSDMDLKVDKIDFDWHFFRLLRRKVVVTKMDVEGVSYRNLAKNKRSKFSVQELLNFYKKPNLFFAFLLNNIKIKNVEVFSSDVKTPVSINNICFSLQTTHKKFSQIKFNLEGKEGWFNLNSDNGIDYSFKWSVNFTSLDKYFVDMRGSLNSIGDVSIGGSLHPTGGVSVFGKNIVAFGGRLAGLKANAQFKNSDNRRANFSLILDKFVYGGINLNNISLNGVLTDNLKNLRMSFASVVAVLSSQAQVHRVKVQGGSIKADIPNRLTLQTGNVTVPDANLNIKNISINVEKKGSELVYNGKGDSGKGNILFSGKTNLDSKKILYTQATVNGKNFQVSNTGFMKLNISPDLKIKFTKNTLDIGGDVVIPFAKISRNDFRSIETLPDDVVFVNGEEKKVSGFSAGFKTYSYIKVLLGDDVNINIAGLKGNLQGQLFIKDYSDRATTASGMITIAEGSYNIYGQILKIKNGNIIFSGGLITKPQLDIKAVRRIEQKATTGVFSVSSDASLVGVHMSGVLPHPKITLFSEPAGVSQTDILSYLVTGQAASHLNDKQAGSLVQAASMLSTGGDGVFTHLIGGLKNKFGLTEVGLETEAQREGKNSDKDSDKDQLLSNTSFVLGKYLSPSLYVSYSIGLFDNSSTVKVRKNFGRRWAIQTESGVLGSGVDLLYNIER